MPLLKVFTRNRSPKLRITLCAAVLLAMPENQAQTTFQERADTLLDYLNSNSPNVDQTGGGPNRRRAKPEEGQTGGGPNRRRAKPEEGRTGGGPNRIGRTGFWYGQGRIARGNTATGLSYISAAVGDADAKGANAGFSLWHGMDAWYLHHTIFSRN